MGQNVRFLTRSGHFASGFLAAFCVIALASITAAGTRIQLSPQFVPGLTLRYQIEMRTSSQGKTVTPIANPEGGSKFSQAVSMIVRLEVLAAATNSSPSAAPSGDADAAQSATGSAKAVRFRVTYEKSHAHSESDAPPVQTPSSDDQYDRLEGHSIEFTAQPNGQLTNVQGLEGIVSSPSDAAPIFSWMNGLSVGSGFPREGISIGQKWTGEKSLSGSPLADLIWRTTSTYLRNESCATPQGPGPAGGAKAGDDQCAVILTRFEILRRGSPHSDATPDDYRRNGLRTSGAWTGSGESLDSISLATGLLVNSTQTSTQHMNYEITDAANGSSIHRTGDVQNQMEITLLPNQQ
jgi:hypothetical protein